MLPISLPNVCLAPSIGLSLAILYGNYPKKGDSPPGKKNTGTMFPEQSSDSAFGQVLLPASTAGPTAVLLQYDAVTMDSSTSVHTSLRTRLGSTACHRLRQRSHSYVCTRLGSAVHSSITVGIVT